MYTIQNWKIWIYFQYSLTDVEMQQIWTVTMRVPITLYRLYSKSLNECHYITVPNQCEAFCILFTM